MSKYHAYRQDFDYRGDRQLKDLGVMAWPDVQVLLGATMAEFTEAKDLGDFHWKFSGRYQAAHGGMESHGARIMLELVD